MFHQERAFGVEEEKAQSVSATIRRLARYFRRYWLMMLLVAGLIIAGTYMQVLVPDLTGQVVDCYLTPFAAGSSVDEAAGGQIPFDIPLQGGPLAESGAATNCWYTTPDSQATADETIAGIGLLVFIIAALYIGNSLVSGLSFYLMRWGGMHVLRDLRAEVFEHVHRLSLGYFTKHEVGDVMSRFTNDMDTLQQAVSFALIQVLQGGLLIAWIIYEMLSKSIPFSLSLIHI